MEQLAHILGATYVQGWRKSCNEDPEGEGWAFRAAENMMSEYDYTLAMTYEKAAEVGEELTKLSSVALVALKEALLPKAPTPAAEVNKAEPGSFDDADVAGHPRCQFECDKFSDTDSKCGACLTEEEIPF
jgi:hypothetical protein